LRFERDMGTNVGSKSKIYDQLIRSIHYKDHITRRSSETYGYDWRETYSVC